MAGDLPEKFTNCYLTDSSQSETVKEEMGKKKNILHYLQNLSRGVTKDCDSEIAYFDKIQQWEKLNRTSELTPVTIKVPPP